MGGFFISSPEAISQNLLVHARVSLLHADQRQPPALRTQSPVQATPEEQPYSLKSACAYVMVLQLSI